MFIKKQGSILILSMIILMCLTLLSISTFKFFYNGVLKNNISYKSNDMYNRGNFNEVLSKVNEYFYNNKESLEIIQSKQIVIDRYIFFSYDSTTNMFFLKYKYRGISYSRKLKYIKNNELLIFIPYEKKYII